MFIVIGGGLEKLIGFNGVVGLEGQPAFCATASAACWALAADEDDGVVVVDDDGVVVVEVDLLVSFTLCFGCDELNPPEAA